MNERKLSRYGVKISKETGRHEYIYDAVGMQPAKMDFKKKKFDFGDWKKIWFVKNNYPVMLKFDGTEDYRLNPNNYAEREDGTPSNISDQDYCGNAMSAIPLVWINQYEDAENEYIVLCTEQYDQSYQAYAHTRADGTVMQIKYLSMFGGYNDGTRLRSLAGKMLSGGKTAKEEIASAEANNEDGAEIWTTRTWADRNLLNCLLTVMSASSDSKESFGAGNNNTWERLKTGTLLKKGQFFGAQDGKTQVKVFHIEKWWGDQWERIQGLLLMKGNVVAKMTKPYNLTGEGHEIVGVSYPSGWDGGYIAETKMTKYGRIPTAYSDTPKAIPEWFIYDSDMPVAVALVGGDCGNGAGCGASCVYLYSAASSTHWAVGAALSCEQPLAA